MVIINRRNAGNSVLTLALFVSLATAATVGCAAGLAASNQTPAAASSEAAMAKNISLMENRFFSRQYPNDPLEKRLERLELLVFGSTQDGDNEERYNRLKSAVASRAQAAASPKAGQKPSDKEVQSSSQYPVLNTLEWRALHKTYPAETLDQRLGRMEKKLFGQENQTMAYVDRVDRLKRTLGIGVTAIKPSGPLGPAPKARPRSQMNDLFGYSAPPMFNDPGEQMDAMPMFDGTGLAGTFSQMFKDLNREMAQMNKLGPGNWVYDSNSGVWTDKNTGKIIRPVKPGQPFSLPDTAGVVPKSKPQLTIPLPRHDNNIMPIPVFPGLHQNNGGLPPYADPNSI